MKLVIGIVNSDDVNELLSEITKASFQATKLSTSGGFLKMGNVTVLVGVEDERVDEVIEIFKECCSRRKQMVSTTPPFFVIAPAIQLLTQIGSVQWRQETAYDIFSSPSI